MDGVPASQTHSGLSSQILPIPYWSMVGGYTHTQMGKATFPVHGYELGQVRNTQRQAYLQIKKNLNLINWKTPFDQNQAWRQVTWV